MGLIRSPLSYAYNVQINRSTETMPFSLVLSRQPPGPTTVDLANLIPNDMTDPSQTQSFPVDFSPSWTSLVRKMDEKLESAHDTTSASSDKTLRRMLQVRPAQQVFVDRKPMGVAESACIVESVRMASAPTTKLLPKTLARFKAIYATKYLVTVDKNGIHNKFPIAKVTPVPSRNHCRDEVVTA